MKRLFSFAVVLFGIAAIGLAFVAGSSALAQAASTVTGVVSDPSGAVLVGANVVLSNTATGTSFTGTTNSAGSYRITNVPPGPGYTLVISHSGFRSFKVDNVYVNVANVFTKNVTLSLGGATVEISVNAAGQGVTLDTEDATIGNNGQGENPNELPIQSRISPAALFTMQPGIAVGGATTGARTDQ